MYFRGMESYVGLAPRPADRLVRLLHETSTSLDAQAARIQALLDQAGVAGTVPLEVRRAARTCGTAAADLARRTLLVDSALGPGSTQCVMGPASKRSPGAVSVLATALGLGDGPWVRVDGRGAGLDRNTTTVLSPDCRSVVYAANRRPGAGRPIPPPDTLPGFPDAKRGRARTPVQGGGLLRRRWTGKNGAIYEWDSRHGTVEVYDRRGRHKGEFDKDTGKRLKPPDPNKKVKP